MRRSNFTLVLAASLFAFTAAALAQSPDQESSQHCTADQYRSDGLVTVAESRDQRLAAASGNHINPGTNGSIRVHGWNQGDVLVRACIHAAAPSDSEAHNILQQVRIARGPGQIVPDGPERSHDRHWDVSYEVWAPVSSNLTLEAHNGSIAVSNIQGKVGFQTLNGSVRLEEVAGEVDGKTTNGSLSIDVAGNSHGIRAETTNGSIRLNLPENYSAKVEASTVNGKVHCDFPAMVSGDIGGKSTSLTIGSGGPLVQAHTVNGSIHIGRRSS